MSSRNSGHFFHKGPSIRVAERELRALVWDEKMDLSVIEAKVKEREALEVICGLWGSRGNGTSSRC